MVVRNERQNQKLWAKNLRAAWALANAQLVWYEHQYRGVLKPPMPSVMHES